MNPDIFGYIGTILVLSSFLIEDVFKLRLVNSIGSVFWIIYGVMTLASPTIIVNSAVLMIHIIWFIRKRNEIQNKKIN
jgi:hypothetical protein